MAAAAAAYQLSIAGAVGLGTTMTIANNMPAMKRWWWLKVLGRSFYRIQFDDSVIPPPHQNAILRFLCAKAAERRVRCRQRVTLKPESPVESLDNLEVVNIPTMAFDFEDDTGGPVHVRPLFSPACALVAIEFWTTDGAFWDESRYNINQNLISMIDDAIQRYRPRRVEVATGPTQPISTGARRRRGANSVNGDVYSPLLTP